MQVCQFPAQIFFIVERVAPHELAGVTQLLAQKIGPLRLGRRNSQRVAKSGGGGRQRRMRFEPVAERQNARQMIRIARQHGVDRFAFAVAIFQKSGGRGDGHQHQQIVGRALMGLQQPLSAAYKIAALQRMHAETEQSLRIERVPVQDLLPEPLGLDVLAGFGGRRGRIDQLRTSRCQRVNRRSPRHCCLRSRRGLAVPSATLAHCRMCRENCRRAPCANATR